MPIIYGKHKGAIKPGKKQIVIMKRAIASSFVPKGTAGPWIGLRPKGTRIA